MVSPGGRVAAVEGEVMVLGENGYKLLLLKRKKHNGRSTNSPLSMLNL